MSFILTEWIQKDVGLKDPFEPDQLEESFSSGYLFGKLLDALGLESNFSGQYVSAKTTEALIKNYTSLESTLRQKLKIRLSSTTALDLIRGKPGSVAKLLYEIKKSIESLPPEALQQSRKKVFKKHKFESYPSSPVGILHLHRRRNNKLDKAVSSTAITVR
jgi:hypothetical protein